VSTEPTKLQRAIESGVFDAEAAAAFLNIPSVSVFHAKRREHGMKGVRFGQEWRYSREWLEALRKAAFGMDGPQRKKA
jgi:hypothetical protein